MMRRYDIANLRHAANHKTQTVSNSICAQLFMTPFTVWTEKFVPDWISPNMISLMGVIPAIASGGIALSSPDLESPLPRWAFFVLALLTLMFVWFDSLDGTHARRTGMRTIMGDIIDHSGDTVTYLFGAMALASVLRLGTSIWSFLIVYLPVLASFAFQWDTYHTNILRFPRISGPTEGMLMVAALELLSGILGPDIWLVSFQNITLGCWAAILVVATLGLTIGNDMGAVLMHRRRIEGDWSAAPLLDFVYPAAQLVTGLLWIHFSPDVYAAMPRVFLAVMGLPLLLWTVELIVGRIGGVAVSPLSGWALLPALAPVAALPLGAFDWPMQASFLYFTETPTLCNYCMFTAMLLGTYTAIWLSRILRQLSDYTHTPILRAFKPVAARPTRPVD
ncbi:putative cholinephosphotransferase 1 [Paratrimastix pyriformis]|uniref:Cholinephosphotransferase 1 n=1 Tax=Paratrimastix pyriformis TaxID=342808 RepID=A0ABQ8UAQ1_9EUKA|nr:putative cholinephosphotransferase 1 [Paratrimastix pyriformis]